MKRVLIAIFALCSVSALAQDKLPAHPLVKVDTTLGNFIIELDARRAPITVRHFLKLVDEQYYDGTIFHRVIKDFMAQGGGYTLALKPKESKDAIPNESGNGLRNLRGTIAMARTDDPHSANAQFFINVVDNLQLDPTPDRWGYAVFGNVIEGMNVVDAMVSIPTGRNGPFSRDVPVAPIEIRKIARFQYE
ncbi:MAG TPA: peptidylprolyl isomerase [Woeseiaceae bacterium]